MSGWLLFLLLLVFTVLVSVVMTTWRTGMSPHPSHTIARTAIFSEVKRLLDARQPQCLIDLGSGWGHLVIPLARQFPQHQVVGYELSFFPWLVSVFLKKLLRLENLDLHRKNFLKADLTDANLLICYLVSPTMEQLSSKLQQLENKPRWLISHFFALPEFQPVNQFELPDLYRSPIYVYCLEKQSKECNNPCLKP
ncbi:hypothetical protein SAMN05660443_0844 [Marinospirillum celere]|uniref:Methyltransferase small domain-containing protein n=1 Tax=Marinospirillum celere TaxID=1122252 RepID=A0A1I1EY80_9GAMM|nr:class I SAM-dependent methyltransferase [Marinospirillum celere]SFB90458.1 hypothetical protein SAMN05660443_0844 [Marinospirillum celere]